MGMAGARSLLSCSLARSLTRGRREAKPAAATSQLSKLPSATFSSPPLPAPPPPPSPSPLQLPAGPQLQRAAARGRPGRGPKGQLQSGCALDADWPGSDKGGEMDQTGPGGVNSERGERQAWTSAPRLAARQHSKETQGSWYLQLFIKSLFPKPACGLVGVLQTLGALKQNNKIIFLRIP